MILSFCSFFSALSGLKLEVEIKPVIEESPSLEPAQGLAFRAMEEHAIPKPAIPEPVPDSQGVTPKWKPPNWEGYPGGNETKFGWKSWGNNVWPYLRNCSTIWVFNMREEGVSNIEYVPWCQGKCYPDPGCKMVEININGSVQSEGMCQIKGCRGLEIGNIPEPTKYRPGWFGWQKVPSGWWDSG